MKEDIKVIEILKEDFNKQLLEQTDKLKTEIDSDNKLKILLKKNKNDISRLNKVVDEFNKNNVSITTITITITKEKIHLRQQ